MTCNCWTSGPMCCRNRQFFIPAMLLPTTADNPFEVPVFKPNATAAAPLIVGRGAYIENNGLHP